jgi:hypothetical protein
MKRTAGVVLACFVVLGAAAGTAAPPGSQEAAMELVKKVTLPANPGWADTGLDVSAGDEFHIVGSGEITLQRNNPSAQCGPAGLDLMTVQQPIPSQNIGALIGKVAQLISVRKDEDTGEEIRDEIVRYFFIGAENDVTMPITGRLYVGINENILKDNGGEFMVEIYRRAR